MIDKNMVESLEYLKARFKYQTDSEQFGANEVWQVMPLGDVMRGDCEDYSLTLLKLLSGGDSGKMFINLLKGTAGLYFVKIKLADGKYYGHCVLKYKGKYCDNNFQAWVDKETMVKANYDFKFKFYLPLIGAKYLASFIAKLFN